MKTYWSRSKQDMPENTGSQSETLEIEPFLIENQQKKRANRIGEPAEEASHGEQRTSRGSEP